MGNVYRNAGTLVNWPVGPSIRAVIANYKGGQLREGGTHCDLNSVGSRRRGASCEEQNPLRQSHSQRCYV